MTKQRWFPEPCRAVLVAAGLIASIAPRLVDGGEAETVAGPGYSLEKVAEGVFCAVSRETAYYVSNSVVIVGDESVLVVDSGATPGGARGLIQAIRGVSDRPIRYLVDTHFHFDHVLGYAAFAADTVLIGHEATRKLLGTDAPRGCTDCSYLDGIPARIARLREEAQAEPSAEKRAALTAQAASLQAYRTESATLVAVPPRLTFSERLSIDLGDREVQILFLGRGHTRGDLVVLLPRERVVCTGDIFNGYIGYMGDAYVDEWADSLERLARLDFETVVPGHGAPFRGKAKIAPVQACLRDLWRQAQDLERAGVPADEAASRIDLRAHAAELPSLAGIGYNPTAIRRIYEVLAERGR
jgi:cyclase